MSPLKWFGVRAGQHFVVYVFVASLTAVVPTRARAQDADHDEDHGHGYLHFSHPLITESPSPDTKFRLDAAFGSSDEPADSHAIGLRGEVEYAFSKSLSLAVVAPFVRVTSPRDARASSLGSVELSAKAASFSFAESGVLVGGGMTVGLPTGSDTKGIGSGHLYELAPFVDAAVRRGDVEMVGFLTYSTTANRNATDENLRSLTFDGSMLWRVISEVELLAEVTTSRSTGGPDGAHSETFLAPGVKWRPSAWPKIALGVAGILGVGDASKSDALQVSAFYHF
jgi:hypothetical protein